MLNVASCSFLEPHITYPLVCRMTRGGLRTLWSGWLKCFRRRRQESIVCIWTFSVARVMTAKKNICKQLIQKGKESTMFYGLTHSIFSLNGWNKTKGYSHLKTGKINVNSCCSSQLFESPNTCQMQIKIFWLISTLLSSNEQVGFESFVLHGSEQ